MNYLSELRQVSLAQQQQQRFGLKQKITSMPEYKQRLYMGVVILFLILYWLKDKTREEKELFYKRLFRK